MGFGLLMIGYFIANLMALNSLGGVFRLIGYTLVLIAAKKLAQYDRNFIFLIFSSCAMIVISAIGAISDVSTFLYKYMLIPSALLEQATTNEFYAIRMFLELIFTAVLCFAVRSIAKETEAHKIVYTSIRNFVFFCIYFVLQLIVLIAYETQDPMLIDFIIGAVVPVWVVLVNILCTILITWMLFSCYSGICDINDLEMNLEPSKSGFIKSIMAKRKQKSQRCIEEAETCEQKLIQKKKTPKGKEG